MVNARSVLIIGGSGFVGSHLALRLREGYKVFATFLTKPLTIPGVTFIPFDVVDRNWVKRAVYMVRPDYVVFAAGNNNLAKCEEDPKATEKVHTSGAAMVANTADIFQPKFIYLSNPYVFDGAKGNYRETESIFPNSALGKAKAAGENFARSKLNYMVVRSSPVMGRGNGRHLAFLDSLRMRLDNGERIELPTDEIHSFATIDGLVDVVSQIIATGIKNRTLHYGGLTKLTYYDFGRRFAEHFGYDPKLIVQAKRPQIKGSTIEYNYDYSLNSTALYEALKLKPLLLEESFDLIEKKLIAAA
jgi:dTDP-4-dehydrorhamnose reductase